MRPTLGASAKAAVPCEPPKKKQKTDDWQLPEALQELQSRPEQLDQALALSGAFHVLELGLVEEWLGHGLIVAWSAHAEYPADAMTVGLVEHITQIQADPSNSVAANCLAEMQRSILKGLVKWHEAVNLFVKIYQLCVTARKDIRKEEIVELMECVPPVVRLLSSMNSPKKYSRQKAHQWQQDVSKLLTLAYLCLEAHKVAEEPEAEGQDAEVTQMDADEVSEDEDFDMAALAAAVRGTG